jgi:hypothetical protein
MDLYTSIELTSDVVAAVEKNFFDRWKYLNLLFQVSCLKLKIWALKDFITRIRHQKFPPFPVLLNLIHLNGEIGL